MQNTKKILLLFFVATLLGACTEPSGPVMYGNFEADEWIIPAEGSGRIVWLGIEEGKTLQKGETVGLIDTIQLGLQKQMAAASLAALQATIPDIEIQTASIRRRIEALEREKARTSRLVEQGSVDQQMLEQLEDQLSVSLSELTAATTALRQQTASILAQKEPMRVQIQILEDKIQRCVIMNPENGVILTRYVGIHEYVNIGHPLYKLANLDEMILRAWFPGDQLAMLEIGGDMEIGIDIPGKGMKHYQGTVASIAQKPQFVPTQVQTKENRTQQHYEVKIRVPNDGSIKAGMPGEVRFTGNRNSGL